MPWIQVVYGRNYKEIYTDGILIFIFCHGCVESVTEDFFLHFKFAFIYLAPHYKPASPTARCFHPFHPRFRYRSKDERG
jgi:hypothetical protein